MNITARATRSGGWWAVEVPEVEGLFTQAKRLDQVEEMVRDAAELLTDDAIDEVLVLPVLPKADLEEVEEAKELTASVEQLQKEAAIKSRRVATKLRDQGLPVRDVAKVMKISPQRVSQLVPAAKVSAKSAKKAAPKTVSTPAAKSSRTAAAKSRKTAAGGSSKASVSRASSASRTTGKSSPTGRTKKF